MLRRGHLDLWTQETWMVRTGGAPLGVPHFAMRSDRAGIWLDGGGQGGKSGLPVS